MLRVDDQIHDQIKLVNMLMARNQLIDGLRIFLLYRVYLDNIFRFEVFKNRVVIDRHNPNLCQGINICIDNHVGLRCFRVQHVPGVLGLHLFMGQCSSYGSLR